MKKEKLFKKWSRYYNLNIFFSIVPTISIIIMMYVFACHIISIDIFAYIIFGILVFSFLIIMLVSHQNKKIITDKNNLNSFLQIAIDNYKSMASNSIWKKRKLNKQMTFALNLKLMLNQFDNSKNESRKKLFDFINNNYYLKNEEEFITLCSNCLKNQENFQDEIDIDKSNINKLTYCFVLSNVKIVIFYTMIIALFSTIIIEYLGEIFIYFPKLNAFLMNKKDYIETANTIIFDIAAILILYFEIKQEDI